jgi:hypothetical protein
MTIGYKTTTIRKILRDRIEDWLSTISNKIIHDHLKENCLVSGGAITSLLLGEKPNDYDIYFKNYNAALTAAKYYVNRFSANQLANNVSKSIQPTVIETTATNIKGEIEKRIKIMIRSAGAAAEGQEAYFYFESRPEIEAINFVDSLDNAITNISMQDLKDIAADVDVSVSPNPKVPPKPRFRPVFMTDNAITLSQNFQLIIRFNGEPNDIHRNFDFVHATCYYDYINDNLQCSKEALHATLSRNLVYIGSLYPVASIFRTRKFLERGWRINAGQLLKIIFQVSQLNLSDKDLLREQLIGVDLAYFAQVLHLLKDAPGGKIDSSYLALILDKVFE